MRMMFRFDDTMPDRPVPIFASEQDGTSREADGSRYFDLAQASERSGQSEAELTLMWNAFARDIAGDPAPEGEVVRDLETGDERQLTFADLSDEEVRERAARMMRAGDFTVDEFAAFVTHAEAIGYDWRARECYPKRVINPDTGKPEIVCIAKIEALESRVLSSGYYNGMNGPFYSADGETWKPYWHGETPPALCKIELFRHGVDRPHVVTTTYGEFQPRDPDDNILPPNQWWRVRYCVMLSKNTRAKGFRECFRDAIGAVYIEEEFGDAGSRRRGPRGREPVAESGPRPVKYAEDAQLGTAVDPDEAGIQTETQLRELLRQLGIPVAVQDTMINDARARLRRADQEAFESDQPSAFYGGIYADARKKFGRVVRRR